MECKAKSRCGVDELQIHYNLQNKDQEDTSCQDVTEIRPDTTHTKTREYWQSAGTTRELICNRAIEQGDAGNDLF